MTSYRVQADVLHERLSFIKLVSQYASLRLHLFSTRAYVFIYRNRNRKLLISRASTKAKSQEPAYSQALNQNKIDRQRSRSRESGRQTVRWLWWMVFGVETGREACG